MTRITALVGVTLAAACHAGGEPLAGLALPNPQDGGPAIVWDLFATPLPEIPFPNDVATRPDPTAITGRRLNLSRQATTGHERAFRALVDELDGFGTYAPLSVRFAGPIDVGALHAAQTDDEPGNDGVMLINVDRRSPGFGAAVPLDVGPGPEDLGQTRFPVLLSPGAHYFLNDAHAGRSNLLFETRDEDADGDGRLAPEEDLDDDGVLDRPNTWTTAQGGAPRRLDEALGYLSAAGLPEATARDYLDLVTAYELETDTLILRPVVPLDPATRYAVVLGRRIVGAGGEGPIRSPFPWVNHLQQTAALAPLVEDGLLERHGLPLEQVAFAWSFTTQSIADELEALRAGLYGVGPFAWLASEFPPQLAAVAQVDDPAYASNVYTLDVERLIGLLSFSPLLAAIGLPEQSADAVFDDYREVIDYLVFAELEAPAYLENGSGAFRVDLATGEAEVDRARLFLTCAVPRGQGNLRQPFPVAVYCNGTGSFRLELLVRAGPLARAGIATCGIDAYGHGLPGLLGEVIAPLLEPEGLGHLGAAMFAGRAKDLNQDGFTDSGGDFWTANTFHTRDVVRQTVLDNLRVVQVLRGFGVGSMPVDVDGDGRLELNGDFDGDGVADLGGEQPYLVSGQSLGGIVAALVGPVEPAIVAAAPISGGGGLADIAFRTTQTGVPEAAFLPVFGPLVVGRPRPSGAAVDLVFDVVDVVSERELPFATLFAGGEDELRVGDRVRLTNLDNGEHDEAVIRAPPAGDLPGAFAVRVAADRFDRLRLELRRAGVDEPYRVVDTFEREVERFYGESYPVGATLVALSEGFGLRRQSPALRRLAAVAQTALERGDPINYARYYAAPIAFRPDGAAPTNLLVLNTVGDTNVPVHTGVALYRAAGFLPAGEIDPPFARSGEQVLLDTFVVEGLEQLRRFAIDGCHHTPASILFDVDDISAGAFGADIPRLGAPRLHPACDGGGAAPSFCRSECVALPPLRLSTATASGTSAMRLLYVRRTGAHGFTWPDVNLTFDPEVYGMKQLVHYFATGGAEVRDDPGMGVYP